MLWPAGDGNFKRALDALLPFYVGKVNVVKRVVAEQRFEVHLVWLDDYVTGKELDRLAQTPQTITVLISPQSGQFTSISTGIASMP